MFQFLWDTVFGLLLLSQSNYEYHSLSFSKSSSVNCEQLCGYSERHLPLHAHIQAGAPSSWLP